MRNDVRDVRGDAVMNAEVKIGVSVGVLKREPMVIEWAYGADMEPFMSAWMSMPSMDAKNK
jgi:hypothetical protein